jgi:hypothetical protein
VLTVAKLLRQLNTTYSLGWFDHDVILDAYKILIPISLEMWEWNMHHLFYHTVLDMSSEETTFVYNAQSSLLFFC